MSNLPSTAASLNSSIIADKLEERMTEFLDRKDFLREVSFATQIIKKGKQLQRASSQSALEAIMNVAQVGLTLNPVMRLAYLVPRWDRAQGGNVVALEPSYQGLIKLLTDTGSVRHAYAHLVYEKDEFSVELGTKVTVRHVPSMEESRGKLTHVYGVAELPDGLQHVEVMTRGDVEEIREASESFKAWKAGKINTCVWNDHEGEMYRKTVLRRMVKYLPKTERWEKLAQAVRLDESDWQISDGQFHYAEGLISTSTFEEHVKQNYELRLSVCTRADYEEMITELQNNQIDPIQHGRNYSQTDIKTKIQREI